MTVGVLPREYLERQVDGHGGSRDDEGRARLRVAQNHKTGRAQRETGSFRIAAKINLREHREALCTRQ
jgi:hypothetical protein